jgi:hypothetical protein
LMQQYEFVKSKPNVVLVGSGCLEIDQSGNALRQHNYPLTHQRMLDRLERLESFPHSSAFFNTKCVRSIGGYRNRFIRSQDFDLWLRFSSAGEIACQNAPLIKLRKHTGSISHHAGGQTQAIMGMAAAVCHFRRKSGFLDLADSEESDWQQFLFWLEQELVTVGYFADRSHWQKLKQSSDERAWPAFFLQTIQHPLRTAKLLKGKVLSVDLPSILSAKSAEIWPS